MRRRRLSRVLVLVISGGLAVVLAACSSVSAPQRHASPGRRVIETAYRKIIDARTAHLSASETVFTERNARAKTLTTVVRGDADFADRDFAVTTVSGGFFTIITKSGSNGNGDLGQNPNNGSYTRSAHLKTIEVSEHVYSQLPSAVRRVFPGHKEWAVVDLATRSNSSVATYSFGVGGSGPINPTGELFELTAVSSRVRRVGVADIGGTRTIQYAAYLDGHELAHRLRSAYGRVLGKLLSNTMRLTRVTHFPVEVWIDKSGRLRRLLQRSLPQRDTGLVGVINNTLTLSDYGAPVHITAPPESEVYKAR